MTPSGTIILTIMFLLFSKEIVIHFPRSITRYGQKKNSWDVSKMNYFLSLTAGIPP